MKTLENKSLDLDTVIVDGLPVVRIKPSSSVKKMSLRPRKSFTRVKSLRPLKAAGKSAETVQSDLN